MPEEGQEEGVTPGKGPRSSRPTGRGQKRACKPAVGASILTAMGPWRPFPSLLGRVQGRDTSQGLMAEPIQGWRLKMQVTGSCPQDLTCWFWRKLQKPPLTNALGEP